MKAERIKITAIEKAGVHVRHSAGILIAHFVHRRTGNGFIRQAGEDGEELHAVVVAKTTARHIHYATRIRLKRKCQRVRRAMP